MQMGRAVGTTADGETCGTMTSSGPGSLVRGARRRPEIWPGVFAALAIGVVAVSGPLVSLTRTGSTAAATANYTLKKITLESGTTVIARWNPCQEAITYQVNLKGLPKADRKPMLKQVQQAFDQLAAADGMVYRYDGSTTFVPKQENLADQPAEIVVAAVDPSQTDLDLAEKSLGFGGVLWATWTGRSGEGAAVVRGYVILAPAGLADLKTGFGKGRRQGNVILHELGHATGLEHVSATSQEMYPALSTKSPNGYASGDRAGLKKVGINAGCLTIPSNVAIADYS
jgi:hypothetical protein